LGYRVVASWQWLALLREGHCLPQAHSSHRGRVAPAAANGAANPRNTSFASLKQIDAGLLNVGYSEAGPANGPAVVLLQGWPYDIYSYVDVAPLLASGTICHKKLRKPSPRLSSTSTFFNTRLTLAW
jgi:hypothetical protein